MPDTEFLAELWDHRIAPQLGLPQGALLTENPQGLGSHSYLVQVGDREYFFRWYSVRAISKMKRYLDAGAYFARSGFSVPEPIGHGKEKEGAWVVERRLPGVSLSGLLGDPQAIEKAAACLARLHGHERNRYGEADTWGGFRLTLRWRQRFAERWVKILRLFPELKPAGGEVESWFQSWADSFSPSSYQLLHGDYHPGALRLLPDGKIGFQDFRFPRFGFGLLEAMEALHRFAGEEPSSWSPFLTVYLDQRGRATKNEWEESNPSLHAVFHLRHADRFADLAIGDRGRVEDRRRWERNAFDSWLRFADLAGIAAPQVEVERESAFLHPSAGV